MELFNQKTYNLKKYFKLRQDLTFPSVFSQLAGNCFYESGIYEIYFNCTDNQEFITIPDSAFYCARSLTIVNIPNSVTSIGNKALS